MLLSEYPHQILFKTVDLGSAVPLSLLEHGAADSPFVLYNLNGTNSINTGILTNQCQASPIVYDPKRNVGVVMKVRHKFTETLPSSTSSFFSNIITRDTTYAKQSVLGSIEYSNPRYFSTRKAGALRQLSVGQARSQLAPQPHTKHCCGKHRCRYCHIQCSHAQLRTRTDGMPSARKCT
jgi:hypothetical protein